jgi:hypothetical protein
VSRILAVVGFDLAVETAMKAAVIALQKAKAPARDFPGVLQQCEALFADAGLGGFPDRANVLHVHDVRNDAQHKARYPSVSEVNDCRTYARDALQKLVETVFQTDLASVSVSNLIADEGNARSLRRLMPRWRRASGATPLLQAQPSSQ